LGYVGSGNSKPRRAGHDVKVGHLLGGAAPPVGLDQADHHVGAPVSPAPTLVQHGERLADAGGGAQVDAQRARRRVPRFAGAAEVAVGVERSTGSAGLTAPMLPGGGTDQRDGV